MYVLAPKPWKLHRASLYIPRTLLLRDRYPVMPNKLNEWMRDRRNHSRMDGYVGKELLAWVGFQWKDKTSRFDDILTTASLSGTRFLLAYWKSHCYRHASNISLDFN